MPFAESNQAAALTFDAAVHRALSRRRSDTPWPHNGAAAPHAMPAAAPVPPPAGSAPEDGDPEPPA